MELYNLREQMKAINDKTLLRERVIAAGQELFHKRGIRAVTMDDVSHQLHISKRTLYQLFDTKERACFLRASKKRWRSTNSKLNISWRRLTTS